MFSALLTKAHRLWTTGSERTLAIKKNILYTFIIRACSVVISFLLVTITIDYLDPLQYGIWVTIASLVAWINTFDIGLGNGLRNKIAHAIAVDDIAPIAKYVTTTYATLFLIGIACFTGFLVAGSFVNWNLLLNVPASVSYSLWPVVLLTVGSFCIQFVLQPINSMLTALQQPFKASLTLFMGQALTLVITYILMQFTRGNLYLLVAVAAGAPVVALLGVTLWLFFTDLRNWKPRWSLIDFGVAKSLLTVGGAFFLIQIGALILYETDNIIITRTLGPLEVGTFNNAYKYFSVITLAFSIIITPYWSAFTDAYAKKDFTWIRRSMRIMRWFCLLLIVPALLLCIISEAFYSFWIGKELIIPRLSLSISMAVYTIVQAWMAIHAYMLNGAGKLRLQLILVLASALLNIPLSVWLVKLLGLPGTVLANTFVMLIMSIFLTRQCELIMARKAAGIWNR